MDSSTSLGRVIFLDQTGSADGSYAVPNGCVALLETSVQRNASGGFGTTITIDGTTRNAYSNFPSTTVFSADFAIAGPGQTISWTFTATATTKYYRLLVLYRATPP